VGYPVDVALIKEGYPPFKTKIVKLELIGFLIRFEVPAYFKVGDYYTSLFQLPVTDEEIRCKCRVIKTYDAIDVVQNDQTVKLFTVELHFVGLIDRQKSLIKKFIERTGQKLT
jgi:hypothetical protein